MMETAFWMLTNEQRRCFGIAPVEEAWERVALPRSKYDDYDTVIWLEGDRVRYIVRHGEMTHVEHALDETLTPDHLFIVPKRATKPIKLSAATIVKRSADILGLSISEDGAIEIASRSRGTPRIANRLLKRVRDFAQVRGNGVITAAIADKALNMLEIDKLGLDNVDRRMLEAIIRFYNGGPVGLETLAATVGEEAVTIEDVCEPYLIQIGFLTRTPRGRCATKLAYEHLGLSYSGLAEQTSLHDWES